MGRDVFLIDLEGRHVMTGIETGQMESPEGIWLRSSACNYVKFTLDGVTYRAVEDPDDGYRSYCRDLVIDESECRYKLPDVEVVCKHRGGYETPEPYSFHHECDILDFYDAVNGKIFLSIGTDDIGDWYPMCVMNYTPENLSCNEETEKEETK